MPADKKTRPAAGPIPINVKRRASTFHPKEGRNALLVHGEDPNKLLQLYADFYDHFRPANLAEATIISQMVAASWRFARISGYESILLTIKAEEIHPEFRKKYTADDYDRLFAEAFEQLLAAGGLGLNINRSLLACRNIFRGALADLEKLRKLKADPGTPSLPPPRNSLLATDLLLSTEPVRSKLYEMPFPSGTEQPAAEAEQDDTHSFYGPDWFDDPAAGTDQGPPVDEPAPPPEANVLRDIHDRPIVFHKQSKPLLPPRDCTLYIPPDIARLLKPPPKK